MFALKIFAMPIPTLQKLYILTCSTTCKGTLGRSKGHLLYII